jgi:hypothetical protein
VRRAEVQWLPRVINVTWQYSKATFGDAFWFDPRIESILHGRRHGGLMRATAPWAAPGEPGVAGLCANCGGRYGAKGGNP